MGEFELIQRHFTRPRRRAVAADDADATRLAPRGGVAGQPGAPPGDVGGQRIARQGGAGPLGDALQRDANAPRVALQRDVVAQRVALGVGDDCALLVPAAGMQLAVSCDMLIEGRHFVATVPAERLGHKALAVNLSDLAACGAEPLAFTLALALPRADDAFVAPFAQGLFALADAHGIELVGGDTTGGPLAICITVIGQVPPGQALLRSGARAGDELWVSGVLGDARLALEVFRGTVALPGASFDSVRRAMELPQPRVALGLALRGVASSAIDLSDGLVGDLGHVLQRSGVGARVELDALPRSAVLAALPAAVQQQCLLAGGDDYELLFTAPPSRHAAVRAAAAQAGVAVSCCGVIEALPGLRVVDHSGQALAVSAFAGFDHFAAPAA